MHNAVSYGVNVTQALDFRDFRLRRYQPTNNVVERRGHVFQRRRESLFRPVALLHGDERLSADPFDFTAQQADILVLAYSLEIGGNNLKLYAGAAGIEDKHVHRGL